MFHSLDAKEVMVAFHTSEKGLSDKEIPRRQEKYGINKISMGKKINPMKILLSQFTDFLIIILIIAAIASYAVGFLPNQHPDIENTVLILIIVVINGIFGFIQDYKAEKSIEALQKISVNRAKVIRDGAVHIVNPIDLVPGDIVLLEAGEKIPADLRIFESAELNIDESILTGESVPSLKNCAPVQKSVALADRKSMAYMNTIVTNGIGKGIVVAIGIKTEVGKIAEQIFKTPDKKTPFTIELDQLGKKIGWIIMGLIIVISLAQFFMGSIEPFTIFMVAISLGVAAIPEGLPAVVTLAMALGTRRMLKRNALVRKLAVVESLGSVDVICTDKTGTLTENRMTVRKLFHNGKMYELTGLGYNIEGSFLHKTKKVKPSLFNELLMCGLACNDATFGVNEDKEETFIGDPTEIALLVSAKKAGLHKTLERVSVIPFSSESKIMVTIHKTKTGHIAYLKGAPENVLKYCKPSKQTLKANEEMASQALRVLGFASKELKNKFTKSDLKSGFTFLGLQGMIDPPRKGVKESIKVCQEAGIIVKMLTGDNMITAIAVAKEIGLGIRAMEGSQIDELDDRQLSQVVSKTDIFARVSPSHKVKILQALQQQGHIVAMTGDGVNDAPALKSSDVGIGMGLRGSDLAKEVSDMILLDDNFITIQKSIEEGRTIFMNIRKFVNYLLTSNFAEVLVVFFISLFGLPAIAAAQLLWINLLTDGMPALALGVDPALPDTMKKSPLKKGEGIINKQLMTTILLVGTIIAVLIVPLFFIGYRKSIGMAQTMVFTALVVYEMLRIAVIREQEKLNFFSNKWLLLAIGTSLVLQLIVLYTPLGQFFDVVPLGLVEWAWILGFGVIGYFASLFVSRILISKRKSL